MLDPYGFDRYKYITERMFSYDAHGERKPMSIGSKNGISKKGKTATSERTKTVT
jgi:hypothetical protein